jgi:DNA-binding GntR family transcriptional regulator
MTAPKSALFSRQAGSQTERAYGLLEEMIVTGELPPASQWSEHALGAKIGLGRSPVRDALQKLAFQRLVRIAPRQGIFISEIDYQGQLQIIEARREIEHLIVAQAALRATGKERQAMARLVQELKKLKRRHDMRSYLRLHFALTSQLGAASRNSYAAEFYAMLQTLARRFLYFHQKHHSELELICDLHIGQLDAVIEGQPEAARQAAAARNDYAEKLARDTIMELIAASEVTIKPVGKAAGI